MKSAFELRLSKAKETPFDEFVALKLSIEENLLKINAEESKRKELKNQLVELLEQQKRLLSVEYYHPVFNNALLSHKLDKKHFYIPYKKGGRLKILAIQRDNLKKVVP